MSRLRIKLGMFDAEGRDDRAWNWAIRFWAFVWRWTGRGYGWMRGMQPCDFCGIDAEDADYMFERVGRGKLACMAGNDCYEDRLLASIPGSQTGDWTTVDDIPTATTLETRGLVTALLGDGNRLFYQRTRAGDAATPNPDGGTEE